MYKLVRKQNEIQQINLLESTKAIETLFTSF